MKRRRKITAPSKRNVQFMRRSCHRKYPPSKSLKNINEKSKYSKSM